MNELNRRLLDGQTALITGASSGIGAASAVVSDDSDYMTGTTLFVDGGMARYPTFREGG